MQTAGAAATASGGAVGMLTRSLGPLAAAFSAAAVAQRVWAAGLKAGDLGEQAEQIGDPEEIAFMVARQAKITAALERFAAKTLKTGAEIRADRDQD